MSKVSSLNFVENKKKSSVASENHAFIKNIVDNLLNKISQKLIYENSEEKVLDYIYNELKVLIPYDRIGIALIQNDTLRYYWAKSRAPMKFLKKGYSTQILKGGSLEKIIVTGNPRIINDLEKYNQENPGSKSSELALKDGIRSSLTYPLIYKGDRIGIIFFSSFEKNIYTESHIEIFHRFSEMVSLIVGYQNLKFFHQNLINDKALVTVVHDLRAPIGVIKGFLGMITNEPWYLALGEEQKEALSIIGRNCNIMLALVEDLGTTKQLERSEVEFHFKEVHLNKLIHEFCRDAEIMAKVKNIHFILETDDLSSEYINCDHLRVRQVLSNLVSNAIKFSKPMTTITFSVFEKESKIFFSISDQGPGIPEDDLSKLFKAFSRTSVCPANGEPSTGLGLYICKQIVEKHQGDITVSTKKGQGSIFQFYIPTKRTT